jgi:hypothetical protein
MLMYVHLSIGVQWNPRLHYDTLPVYLVYPYESKSLYRMTMLSDSRLQIAATIASAGVEVGSDCHGFHRGIAKDSVRI